MFQHRFFNKMNVVLLSTIGLYIYIIFKNKFNLILVNPTYQIQKRHEYTYIYDVILIIVMSTFILILIIKKISFLFSDVWLIPLFLFIPTIYLLLYTKTIFLFFITYEILLLLTTLLIKYTSPNIRSGMITLYFVLWTQLSSFFLWIAVIYIYINTNSFIVDSLCFTTLSNQHKNIIKFLLFLSFSIKLPLWPFSFWLIKTHVEANTSFSIFLSGVLVKTALIGLLKFNFFLINTNNTLVLCIVLISFITTTFSINYQVDFKRLIAYTTVQEMSLILFFILFNGYINTVIISYFILLHTIMSIILFYLNDIIYIRFRTRKTKLLLGLAVLTPKLNIIILLTWLFFISVPVSYKFLFECLIILKVMDTITFITVTIIVFLQIATVIFFTKNYITYSFGCNNNNITDITKNEFFLFFIILLMLTVLVL